MSFSDDQPHTRTRLPVGDLPPPQTGRQPRPLRTLLTVLGIVVLLVVAISIANHGKPDPRPGTGTTAATGGNAGAGSGTGGTADQAAPTAPTGQRPVDTTSNGIASGFPHSSQGAQSAAANYAVALGSAAMYAADSRHTVIATIATPATAAALQSRLDAAFAGGAAAKYGLDEHGAAPAGLTFVSRTIPVGTRAEVYGDAAARVSVWSNGLIGLAGQGSTQPVAENWFTLTLDLRWVGNDWKVADYRQQSGPAPVNGDQQAASADEIKNAAEQYGGFRYAR
ncbi:hypothetical protein ACIQGZ_28400 [Streptomyces sp. NPDC092296]|uniref:hypothetical protein n=1 Tax=Streptomyces sp. NPDC092296 TaxID=3366012 RepID=UPI0038169C27